MMNESIPIIHREVQYSVGEIYITCCSKKLSKWQLLVHPVTKVLAVNIGSGNDLVPAGTKPLPEPILTSNIATILISASNY